MQTLNTPQVIDQPFANTGQKNTIPSAPTGTNLASLAEGFPTVTSVPIPDGGLPPTRADFNGLGYLCTDPAFFQQNGGSYTFNQDVSNKIGGYPLNAILWYLPPSGNSYQVQSLIPNNVNNFVTNPSFIDGIKWKKVFDEKSKMDTTGDNATWSQTSKETIIGWGMPDYNNTVYNIISGNILNITKNYTAPSDGIIFIYAVNVSNAASQVTISSVTNPTTRAKFNLLVGFSAGIPIVIKKGETLGVYASNATTNVDGALTYFAPYKGGI